MVHRPVLSLIETGFVETAHIGQMDLEPPETTDAQGTLVSEFEETTGEIVADVVQIGRDGVRSAAEIEVVREVEFIGEELDEK